MAKANEKKWWMSKMVWFNVVMTVVGVLAVAVDYAPEAWLPVVMAVQGALNVVLRVWFTSTKLVK